MPDLKSELSKVLNEWNSSEPTTMTKPTSSVHFAVTNNVCRATFDYVRDNPGKKRVEINKAMEAKGFNAGSVSSLLGQMLKQGMLRESAHLLYATIPEYTPLKSSKKLKAMAEKPQTPAAPQRKVVKLVNPNTGKVLNPPPVEKEWEPNDVIDKLTVHQAIALFKALRSILVG
jgi:hypothetical protein